MKEKTLLKLEYPKILAKLADYASFGLSRELAQGLRPAEHLPEAEERLNETSEAREILRLYPMFSLGGLRDIREALHKAGIGGVLEIPELLDIGDVCRASRNAKQFLAQMKGNFPLTQALGRELGIFKTIESALDKAISNEGRIADAASEALAKIRKRIKVAEERIRQRLDAFVANAATAKYLQEPIVTIRANRFVVPVKQEYRSQVPGIVHDMSASGATLFIEPLGIMEANNDLQRLQKEEEEEIKAILKALTLLIFGFRDDLSWSLETLARLDFILAKGRLSEEMDAVKPKLNAISQIRLVKARHPLLEKSIVVPIDVALAPSLRTMVITGPNTGGKTISLKTVGLLSLMGLAGLHLPADSGTEIAFYRQIFADIGDEQSIEQSLSTFSSHMVNIVQILKLAGPDTLVLLDELGAGTDPQEGAALAMAILDYLHKRGCKVAATTHYSELKSFSYNRQGFINASVEFDVESLRPTYRLLMGIPGRSNAFEIAKRLGLGQEIIDKAGGFMSAEEVRAGDLISSLEEEKRKAKEERKTAEALTQSLKEQQKALQAEQVALHNREAELLQKAYEESLAIVKSTRESAEALHKEWREKLQEGGLGGNRETQLAKEKLKSLEAQLRDKLPEMQYQGQAPETVAPGQAVEIPKLRQKGYALSAPGANGDVQVQAGILKITVKLADLRLIEAEERKESAQRLGRLSREKAAAISPELDLRGEAADAAIERLDKYLDDAFIAGLKSVRIIHGKGTGVLRAAIAEHLKKHRFVKEARLGDFNEGGAGVTVATLDL